MNIIKNLFAQIEKLITEHGSATILKERIELLKDQYSALEQKVKDLEKENNSLRSELENATEEIYRLNKLTQSPQRTTDQKKKKLDKVTEQILQQFFDSEHGLSIEYFTSSLSLGNSVVKYHFDILLEREYIDFASAGLDLPGCSGSTTYSISSEGRKYIIEIIRSQ